MTGRARRAKRTAVRDGRSAQERSRQVQLAIKHLLDRSFAVGGLIALSPLFALIGTAVRLEDGGPAFFKHLRPGRGEEPFHVYKFRTMVQGADALLRADGRVGDRSRVTRVGTLLRFTSLDELPQLINIAKGEMSFVGPRPAAIEQLERLTKVQLGRFRMKPGVTGLAQINGRNMLKWSKRIEYDNEYIDSYSLALDLRILLNTIPVVLLRRGISLDRNPEMVDDLPPRRVRGGRTRRGDG